MASNTSMFEELLGDGYLVKQKVQETCALMRQCMEEMEDLLARDGIENNARYVELIKWMNGSIRSMLESTGKAWDCYRALLQGVVSEIEGDDSSVDEFEVTEEVEITTKKE